MRPVYYFADKFLQFCSSREWLFPYKIGGRIPNPKNVPVIIAPMCPIISIPYLLAELKANIKQIAINIMNSHRRTTFYFKKLQFITILDM